MTLFCISFISFFESTAISFLSGAMENEAMAEINEFFVTNPYQHSENAENLRTAQMQSPPMSSYTAPVYKTEAPDYSFETAQLYEPVVTDGVFPQQPEQPVVRTAAGGECHGVMKMDTECFEQNEPITSNYQFNTAEFTYNMVQRMPIEQMKVRELNAEVCGTRGILCVQAVYLAGEQQQYQQPLGVHPSSSSEAVQHHNVEATTEYKVGEEVSSKSGCHADMLSIQVVSSSLASACCRIRRHTEALSHLA